MLFATGLTIQIAGFTALDITIPPLLDKPFRIFRAIGRFGWAASYLIILGALVVVMCIEKKTFAYLLIGVACLFQLLDVQNAHCSSKIRSFNSLEQQPDLLPLAVFLQDYKKHWNGEVYKIANSLELEAFQREDAVLAKFGARMFSSTHSARQSYSQVQRAQIQTVEMLIQRRPALYVITQDRSDLVPKEGFMAIKHRGFVVGVFLSR